MHLYIDNSIARGEVRATCWFKSSTPLTGDVSSVESVAEDLMTLMSSRRAALMVYIVTLAAIFVCPTISTAGTVARVARPVANQYMVFFRDGAVFDPHVTATAMEQQLGIRTGFVFEKSFTGFSFEGSPAVARALADDLRTLFVCEVGTGTVTSTFQQNNPPSWGLDRVDQHYLPLDQIYHYDYTGHTLFGPWVTIYVFDSGINHISELNNVSGPNGVTRIIAERNFVIPPAVPSPGEKDDKDCGGQYIRTATDAYDRVNCGGEGHGTNTASVAAGLNYGVARGANIVNYRVSGNDLVTNNAAVVMAINTMINRHNSLGSELAVANFSVSVGGIDSGVDFAIYSALYYGIEVVASATDSGQSACNYSPGRAGDSSFYKTNPNGLNAITVGATTIADQVNSTTAYGKCVDMFAPAMGITSVNSNGLPVTSYGYSSAAAAYASGVAAIQLEQTGLAPLALQARLKQLATPNILTYPGNPTWFTNPTTATANLLLYSLSY